MGGDELDIEVDRLKADRALGKSDALWKLFEFLLERSRAGAPPKEIEIAVAVFGAGTRFDVSQDASVRVYVHRLRKKLDEFYARAGEGPSGRLALPKGEYRLVLESAASSDDELAGRRRLSRWLAAPRAWMAVGLALVLLNGLIWAAFWMTRSPDDGFGYARRSPPWSALLHDERPTLLVIGDYYIFGEIDPATGVDRLVRDYTINSRSDLDDYLMANPALGERYTDLDLRYLPVASAFALRSLLPFLERGLGASKRPRIVMVSELTADMLKRNNIIYVGYLSGLGILREPVFAGSRFSVGVTYDELIDSVDQRRYVSQEGGAERGDETRRDFGYLSAFTGPSGNQIVIIAGTRDIAVMQTAEAVIDRAALQAIRRKTGDAPAFEALYQVEGIGRMNLRGRLISASPLKAENIWSARPSGRNFPAG